MKQGLIIDPNSGTKQWFLNEKFHRTDGPAIECANGNKWWYLNGKLHRTDGPAIDFSIGNKTKVWYIYGKKYINEQEWKQEIRKLKLDKILKQL